MLTRVACAGASLAALLAALLTLTPPLPGDPDGGWVVFVLGAIAFAASAWRPALMGGQWAWPAVGGVTLLGLLAGLFATRTTICCQFVVSVHYGLPYPWARKSAEYGSLGGDGPPETFDEDAVWAVDGFYLLLDVAFWASLAVALVVLVGLLRRARARSRPASA